MRSLLAAATVLIALAGAGEAAARIVVVHDDQGRSITFDVRAANADVEWYAGFLRRAAHGNEISRVTIRIVARSEVAETCGADAGGCYGQRGGSGVMVVPAGRGAAEVHTLLHEYAHHLDHAHGVEGVPEPNGTAHWWQARGMEALVAAGEVAFDYSRGWSRSIGEIFAEDYARLHLRLPYGIPWREPPGEDVRAALRLDVEGVPDTSGIPPPLVIARTGLLGPGKSQSVPFGLLGPGRRVTFSVRLRGEARTGVRGRLVLLCSGRSIVRTLARGQRAATIDERGLGPADSCRVELRSTSKVRHRYTLRLTLAIEAQESAPSGVFSR